ncbi:MAG TPA: macrolide family glycosyltransferase [Herpetosiphonaceae bacterium]
MARTVVLNIPLYGHVNPTLAVVRELVARGEEIIYYSSDTFKDRIQQTGAVYRSYDTLFVDPALQANPTDFSLLVIKECLHVLPQVLDEVRASQPDYILYDSLCVTGRFLAQILNLPAIMFCSTHAGGIFMMVRKTYDPLPAPTVIAHNAFGAASGEQPKDVLMMHAPSPNLVPPIGEGPPKDVLMMHAPSPNLVPPMGEGPPKDVLMMHAPSPNLVPPMGEGPPKDVLMMHAPSPNLVPPMQIQQMPAGIVPVLADAALPPPSGKYVSGEQITEIQAAIHGALAELSTTYGLPPIEPSSIYDHAEKLNIVFLPRAFQARSETFDERFVFVGPSIVPQPETLSPLMRAPGRPTLYISLGTLFNAWPEFFASCIEAFGNSEWQVLMAIGERVDPASLGVLPDNISVAPYVPQLAVLANTDVFITHGGMNSTMEALSYGVPLVVIPQMAEQAITAKRVAEMGLGLTLDKYTMTVEMLRDAAARVLNEASFREQAAQMQAAIREAGGYKCAADTIMQFITA